MHSAERMHSNSAVVSQQCLYHEYFHVQHYDGFKFNSTLNAAFQLNCHVMCLTMYSLNYSHEAMLNKRKHPSVLRSYLVTLSHWPPCVTTRRYGLMTCMSIRCSWSPMITVRHRRPDESLSSSLSPGRRLAVATGVSSGHKETEQNAQTTLRLGAFEITWNQQNWNINFT